MTRYDLTTIALLIGAGVFSTAVMIQDYGAGYTDGALRMCQQVTGGRGEVNGEICQVRIGNVWVTPRLEMRGEG